MGYISNNKNTPAYIAEKRDFHRKTLIFAKNGKNRQKHYILCFTKKFYTLFCVFALTFFSGAL